MVESESNRPGEALGVGWEGDGVGIGWGGVGGVGGCSKSLITLIVGYLGATTLSKTMKT
jgi:hypothetical protein